MSETVKPRGIAAMSPENRRLVAQAGGRAVSSNRAYMSAIGRKGGLAVSNDRAHMSRIGAAGGVARRKKRDQAQNQGENNQ